MKIDPARIRAARALLDWTQDRLAMAAGLSALSVSNIEKGAQDPSARTLDKIRRALEAGGIAFTERGLERRDTAVYEIGGGPDWWVRVLDDARASLEGAPGAEILFLFSDDRESPPEVNARLRAMRASGIGVRQIVCAGNTHLLGSESEYRWVPAEYFKNRVTLVYGDKTAICAEDNTKAVIVKDAGLAETWRNLFEMLWRGVSLSKPDRSTANEEDRF